MGTKTCDLYSLCELTPRGLCPSPSGGISNTWLELRVSVQSIAAVKTRCDSGGVLARQVVDLFLYLEMVVLWTALALLYAFCNAEGATSRRQLQQGKKLSLVEGPHLMQLAVAQ